MQKIPGFAAAAVALKSPPIIKYRFDFGAAFGGSFTTAPIIAFVNFIVQEVIVGMLLWPNRITVPILELLGPVDPDIALEVERLNGRQRGVIKVQVLAGRELKVRKAGGCVVCVCVGVLWKVLLLIERRSCACCPGGRGARGARAQCQTPRRPHPHTPTNTQHTHTQTNKHVKSFDTLTGKSDPLVEVFTTPEHRCATRHISNSLSPSWNETFYLPVLEKDQTLRVEVFDHDAVNLKEAATLQVWKAPGAAFGAKEFMARAAVPLAPFIDYEGLDEETWFPLGRGDWTNLGGPGKGEVEGISPL